LFPSAAKDVSDVDSGKFFFEAAIQWTGEKGGRKQESNVSFLGVGRKERITAIANGEREREI
jgi:hypothetical protein